MNGRVIAGAVLVLLIVVGGIFLVVGNSEGGNSGLGPVESPRSAPQGSPGLVTGG